MATIVLEYRDGIAVVEVAPPSRVAEHPEWGRPVRTQADRIWIGLAPYEPSPDLRRGEPTAWYLAAGESPLSDVHAAPDLMPGMGFAEACDVLADLEGLKSVRLNGTILWASPATDEEFDGMLP